MPIPPLDKVLFKPDEKVFVINPFKGSPEIQNTAKALDLADAAVLFATRAAHLAKQAGTLKQVPPEALLWVCFPKAGKLETHLGGSRARMCMKEQGFEGVKVLSVDETWSDFSFKR